MKLRKKAIAVLVKNTEKEKKKEKKTNGNLI